MPKSVLVLDAIATHRIRLAALLESAHYSVVTASGVTDFQGNPGDYDLVLFGLPDDRPGAVVAKLGAGLQGSGTPILCLDARGSPLRRLLVLRAGARDVLPSKSPDDLMLARIRGLIRERETEKECERRRMTAASFGFSEAVQAFERQSRIVCTGSSAALPERLSAVLPHQVVVAEAGEILKNDAPRAAPDAIVVWVDGDGSAIDMLLPELRDRMPLGQPPVMVIYPPDRPDLATRALMQGAKEVAVQTAGFEEFELRIRNMLVRKHLRDVLRLADEQSYRLAATDPLTGLYNRRYAETYLADFLARSAGKAAEFCLVMVDVDHFKRVNDRYGHSVGDRVLAEIAHRLQDNVRACDLVARYGGEEFLIVLPDTHVSDAMSMAERLLKAVSASPVRSGDTATVTVTASIGVASAQVDGQIVAHRNGTSGRFESFTKGPFLPILEAADAALYRAKNTGRNRVEVNAA
ncbi:MAG: diguanylate cyclase [Silicimonas sp.]|jgi:two-component system cell cycle response regulator|nr:diguanylate cyclase [Silicimonas sp.]